MRQVQRSAGQQSSEGVKPPARHFSDCHGLRIVDLARLSDRSWVTAQSWHKGKTSPELADALNIVRALRAKGIDAQLNDFDPEQKAAA